jgi:excisionase family DNA binding protein
VLLLLLGDVAEEQAASGMIEPLLSTKDVAARVGLSEKAIRRAIARRELRAFKVCGRIRIAPAAVEVWLEESLVEPAVRPEVPRLRSTPAANGLRVLFAAERQES